VVPYRPTHRTQARAADARERIVRAALDQIAEGGYASAAVQVVARRAGVATGSVYRHFPSKAELFAEVFRRASQRELDVVAEVTAADGRTAAERVAAGVEAFARRALAAPVRAYALIAEPVDPAVEAERLVFRRGYRDVFARVLEEGISDGELDPHDSRVVASALVGALGEALVGPLSPARSANGSSGKVFAAGGGRGRKALVSTIVEFCVNSLPARESHVEEGHVRDRAAA
jgi:AcrR family transcriptional regulator